tara:strand:+ start:92 stop:265 length:174 start_codon:yes stop_codon:yes gene_type:complete
MNIPSIDKYDPILTLILPPTVINKLLINATNKGVAKIKEIITSIPNIYLSFTIIIIF